MSGNRHEYSGGGELRSIVDSKGLTTYTHNKDGQIETITNADGVTSLVYFPNGRLKSIIFANGSTHEYQYNSLGFRQSIVRNDGTKTTYLYSPAGNLIKSVGFDAAGRNIGQSYDTDDSYRTLAVNHDAGYVTRVTYDALGNPESISRSDDPKTSVVSYTYDALNRLVAVSEGQKIVGSYVYSGAEADLRDQMDHHAMRVLSPSARYSSTIGSTDAILYARPYGSPFGAVSFNAQTQSFDLASDEGAVPSELVEENSLQRRALLSLGEGTAVARSDFDRPSNIIFVPPEYPTINCAQNCVFWGIDIRANGSYNNISVAFGSTVTFQAGSPQGATNEGCQLLICDWSDNGLPIGFGKTFAYTFTTAGAHDVTASCECSPCDLNGIDDTVVTVASCASGVALQSLTQATNPSNRTRTKIGVGEPVTLTLSPSPACSVSWTKVGSGTISANSGNSIVFTAPSVAGTTTVKANVGGTNRQIAFTIVEPSNETAIKTGTMPPLGTVGAGMLLDITFHPNDVSFEHVEVRELASPATNKTGFFTNVPLPTHNPPLIWAGITPGNQGTDDVAFWMTPSAGTVLSPGTFEYQIPVRWRVKNTSTDKALPGAVQRGELMNSAGKFKISKFGQSQIRTP